MERFESQISERERAVRNILDALRRGDWRETARGESMGGNAGTGNIAVNATVKKRTGEIVAFGNIQDIPKEIVRDPEHGEATFLYHYGRMSRDRIRFPDQHFADVFGRGISEEALANLKEAVARYEAERKQEG